MNLEWTKHLSNEKDKKDFEENLKRNTLIVGRLREILHNRLGQLDRADFSESDFEQPNWSEKQAKRIGKRAAYHEILELLDFSKRIIKV